MLLYQDAGIKKHIHKPQVTNLDAYAIEGMRLQMGAPIK